jgi:hypothetical protein
MSEPAAIAAAAVPSPAAILPFRPGSRSTPPQTPFPHRLARAGLSIASHVHEACEGTAVGGDGVHIGTLVGILATLAAEAALQAACDNRRVGLDVAPGGWVRGGIADPLLFQGTSGGAVTTVWDLVITPAMDRAAPVFPDLDAVLAQAEAAVGERPYPLLTVSPDLKPRALLRATAARHRHAVLALAADEGLATAHEHALALGAALAHVVRAENGHAEVLQLAAEVLIGAARLAPIPYAVS